MPRLSADISLDLDNQWSYMKTHGDPMWETFPSYLPTVVPHILSILDEHRLRATVFVVGQDAEIPSNLPALKRIAEAGHEIANHSFGHEPWLQEYTAQQIEEELRRAESAIAKITEQQLVGFRGPGYSLSQDVLEILCDRGYRYDASTFPTFLGPLARTYYFLKSSFTSEQAEQRKQLFGSFRDGFRRLKPYRWDVSSREILEFPVTTIPIVRIPMHFSYLMYLAQWSPWLAKFYFRMAILACQLTRTGPSMLLHPLDFLGGDEVPELAFFPGMRLLGESKRELTSHLIGMYSRAFSVTHMAQRSRQLAEVSLPRRTFRQ